MECSIFDILCEIHGLDTDNLNYVFEDLEDNEYGSIVKIFKELSKKEKGFISPNHPDRYIDSPYVIYRKVEYKNNTPVGFIELFKLDKRNGIPEVSIAVSKNWRRKGISEKLFKAAIDYCKKNGEKYLLWRCDGNNIASMKFAEKFGFELYDHNADEYTYRYRIT